jgi:hypothetical protein
MKKTILLGAALVSSLFLAGCSDDDDDTPVAAKASVRAVHLSPDAPAVDVAVNDSVVLEDVSYRQASGFLSVNAGNIGLEVRVANTDTVALAADLNLTKDTNYTVIAANNVASIEALVIEDDNLPAAGFSQLRVVHGAPAAPAVDVYVSAPDDDFADLTPTLENVPFKAISGELEVASGDYRVRVTATGSTDVIYDSGVLSLVGGVEYVAVASAVEAGPSPIGLTILTSLADTPVVLVDDARTRVRVVHASADAPAVDILVDDATVLDAVPFGVASGYLELLGGTYNIDVAADASGAVVIDADLNLIAQSDYTVLAVNALSQIEPLVLEDNNSAPAAGNIKLRLVHAAVNAGLVDIYITAPGEDISALDPTISDFAFKADSGYLEVPAGDYQVRITLANTTTVAIDTGAVTLAEGVVRTAVALDPAPGSAEFTALLMADLN